MPIAADLEVVIRKDNLLQEVDKDGSGIETYLPVGLHNGFSTRRLVSRLLPRNLTLLHEGDEGGDLKSNF